MEDNEETGQEKQTAGIPTFSKNIVVAVGKHGEIHLRRPVAKELNAFDKQSHPTSRKGLQPEKANPNGARVTLFNAIFLKAVKCTDDDGNIPENGVDRIPDDYKSYIIIQFVQSKENVDLKN